MTTINKETHRILTLATAIDEAGIHSVNFQRKSHINAVVVEVFPTGNCWADGADPEYARTIYLDWEAALPKLRKLRHDLEQMLKAGKAKAMEVAA